MSVFVSVSLTVSVPVSLSVSRLFVTVILRHYEYLRRHGNYLVNESLYNVAGKPKGPLTLEGMEKID
jgi:hypothetical protein